jgi:glycosyltransferase involved in cell wall biosynthesis
VKSLRISAGFDPRHGGPAHSTLSSALAVHEAGIRVEVATVDEGMASAPAIERLRAAGVNVHAFRLSNVPAGRRVTISRALATWVWVNADRFDVIHVHGAWTVSSLAGLVAGRVRGVPVVLTAHESMTDYDLATSGIAMRALKRLLRAVYFLAASAVVYSSELERRDSSPRGGARQAVIPHPVAAVSEPRVRDDVNGTIRIGFLGRFDPKKNLDVLLRALPADAELFIAGDGSAEQRQGLRGVAREAGVEERVRWLGFVEGDRKAKFFNRIDLLVMPSRYECFGMVAAEALEAGVPVVVSPSTGIAALVGRHDCGYVVAPEEGRLRTVLSKHEELQAKASRAQSAIEAELTPARHASALADVYRAVVQQGS